MALQDVRMRIVGEDRTVAAFRSVESKLKNISKFATLLRGGGIAAGVTMAVRALDQMAAKMGEGDVQARKFHRALSGIADTFKNPLRQAIYGLAEPLAWLDRKLKAGWREFERLRVEAWEKWQGPGTTPAGPLSGRAGRVQRTPGAALFEDTGDASLFEKEKADREKAADDARKRADEYRRQDIAAWRRMKDLRIAAINEEEEKKKKAADEFRKSDEKAWQAMKDMREKDLEKFEEQAQAFGDLFERIVVESADMSFKELLKSWVKTLLLMEAKAQAINLFKIIRGGTAGQGGPVSKLLGFASGGSFEVGGRSGTDSNVVAFRATAGERVTVSPRGAGGGGGVTIVQNVDARGSSDPAQIARAMRIAKEEAKAEMVDLMRRGRFA